MNSQLKSHLLVVLLILATSSSVVAQRELRAGTQISFDDGSPTPFSITLKAPTTPNLLAIWKLTLPPTVPPAATNWYLVANSNGISRWATFNQDSNFWMAFLNPVIGGNTWMHTPNYNFLGTDNNVTLNVRVNNSASTASAQAGTGTTGVGVVWALTANTKSPNLIGGYNGNSATSGAQGVTIHGGGQSGSPNRISNAASSYTTILGGQNNNISGGLNGTILGGSSNSLSGSSATVSGNSNSAAGDSSTVFGNANTSSGRYSVALGDNLISSGRSSLAMGQYLTAGNAANTMMLGLGVSGTPQVNNQAGSLFVGFATNAASAANPTLSVFGKYVGVGISNPNARLRVKGEANTGGLYTLDVRDNTDNQPGSHFFVFHYASAGYYAPNNPVTLTRNGGVIGIGDPFGGTEIGHGATVIWPLVTDTARVTVRGLGTTASTLAMEIENGRTLIPDTLIRMRDDGNFSLGSRMHDFNSITIKGSVGPAQQGARSGGLGFDLGSCALRWEDIYIGTTMRFDFERAHVGYAASYMDFDIMDTTIVGTADVSQDSHTSPDPAASMDAWQSFSPGGTGSIDHIDVYFANYTANANVTFTLYTGEGTGGGAVRTVTRQLPAVVSAQYISFDFTPYDLFNCGSQMTWRVQSDGSFTLQQYDDTPPRYGGTGTPATYDFVNTPGGWSHTSGTYSGGKANISTPLDQQDTLCGPVSAGLGPCRLPHDQTTDSVQSIQDIPNTYVLDYRFKTYRIKMPSVAVAIKSGASNHFVGLNGTTSPQGQLDIPSTSGAAIVPRMTFVQMNALPAVRGSIVYVTDIPNIGMWGYDNTAGGSWKKF